MRKALTALLLILLLSPFLLFADAPVVGFGSSQGHYLFGQIRQNLLFEVNIREDALPFNLDAPQVQYNAAYQSVATGINIGTYTLVSNSPYVKLTVSHNALVNRDAGIQSHNTINYRLYLMTGTGSSFVSTTGDVVEIDGTAFANDGLVDLSNRYMYVTLDEGNSDTTATVLNALADGTYESTISFSIWVI